MSDFQIQHAQTIKRLQAAASERAQKSASLADPVKGIAKWSDATPILLLPVRLETRFKTAPGAAGAAALEQLWVRIYPDDCAVDTFEPALSATELASGRQYWIDEWAAGGIEAQRRSAWRNLVANHGTGRAAWIIKQFAAATAAPVKGNSTDILLIIAADAPPTQQVQEALRVYWKAVWLADGNAADVDAATQVLSTSPGVVDARELVTQFAPANFATSPLPPLKRTDITLDVKWLRLPAVTPGRTQSWSAPARVNVLPDCFVVLGYQGGQLVFEATGGIIPPSLVAGPDPAATPDLQMKHDADGNLTLPDEMQWMADFDAAVAAGMGIRITLDPAKVDLTKPLQRVLAIGLRLSDDADDARARLEELLTHHRYGQPSLAFIPQGTPTNNTDNVPAGYSRVQDADAAFDALFSAGAAVSSTSDWWKRQDGQWLADALGIDAAAFDRVAGASGTDFAEARAMNRALWPATLGYSMQTVLHPVFNDAAVSATRWFYTHFVAGRGLLPGIRIGKQPYGVLPISAISQWKWLQTDRLAAVGGLDLPSNFIAYRQGLATVLGEMRTDWKTLAATVSRVGQPGDAHQILLDVIGLHPASVEYHQRYVEGLDHLFNLAKFDGVAAQLIQSLRARNLTAAALSLLRRLGYTGPLEPDALSRFFFSNSNRLNGPIIDDRPLSESDPIRSYTSDGRNYIQWLADAGRGSFEDLRQGRGFTDNQAPDALLYVMLRHAILLGYWDSSLQLFAQAGVMDAPAVFAAQRESSFVHVDAAVGVSESRFAPLYSQDIRVTQTANQTVAARIGAVLGTVGTQSLADQLQALDLLKSLPTARLERCFAEHLDTATYRLDAWLLGLVHYQLAALRYAPAQRQGEAQIRRGVFLGAFGWLENLQRKSAPLQPVKLEGQLATVFSGPGLRPLLQDPTNGGYLAAPSINHATTAAILRAGYLANASAQNPEALAVNLSSARVRVALSLIEGIRNGQPLGALLGYQIQRGLHEGHPGVELDTFFYSLRKQFPLVANQMASTVAPAGQPIETVEANNVLDGLKLINHIRTSGKRPYPFGLTTQLPPADPTQSAAIDAEVDALFDAYDAIADLALAEGVHQAVLGNYDRVSATLDAYSKGTFPPEPDVVRTPRSGFGLTHRVGLHFEAGVDPDPTPIAGVPVSPRSQAQAMVNKWLAGILPPPDQIGCRVQWIDPVTAAPKETIATQKLLQLQPIDLLYLVTVDANTALSELDDRILRFVFTEAGAPRADAVIKILHTARLAAPLKSFFEVAPLIRHLRSLLLRSKPLAPTDLTPIQQASHDHDVARTIDPERVAKVQTGLDTLSQDIAAATIAAPVDTAITNVIALFERAARFGIQQVGWGFIYEWKRSTYDDLMQRVRDVADRWDDRLAKFDAGLIVYDALPVATTEDERFPQLGRLDLLVAGKVINPRPTTAAAYRGQLPARRVLFTMKRATLTTLLTRTDSSLAKLLADVQAALPDAAFDLTPFSVSDVGDSVARFIADLASRVGTLQTEVMRRLTAADTNVQTYDASADVAVQVSSLQAAGSALLGEEVKLIPEFSFTPEATVELTSALGSAKKGTPTTYLSARLSSDFPVDDWMHGVARVREKIYAWEQAGTLAEALAQRSLDLLPLQLPFRAGEQWLAMDFDPATVLDGERLLYTAHYAVPLDPTKATCGVLLDEWTEVIPAHDETVGVGFNYDRPGSEAPQTWLLVTPAQMQGQWQWTDLVAALHEALDIAQLRAVEPGQVDTTPYPAFLPATSSATSLHPISISANFSRVNGVIERIPETGNG